jgi:transcription initiation factor TFIID subunit 6
MRHGRRTTLTTADIDQALRVLNIEPLYGHSPHNPPAFRRALPFPQLPSAGPVYFLEDEEIDFDRVLREEKIALPKGVSWTAHWLAVEGVQPLIPENPPAIPKNPEPTSTSSPPRPNGIAPLPASPSRPVVAKKQQQQQQPNQQLVKQVLSRELQLYYTRLTSSLLPPSSSDQAKRSAALASLRNDAGLQALLPYLIRWVGEAVVGGLKEGAQNETDGKVLQVLMDVIGAILDNTTLFVEPYVSLDMLSAPYFAQSEPASPNSPTNTLNPSSFNTSSISRNTLTHNCSTNSFTLTHPTLNDIPFTLTSYHENPSFRAHCTRKRSWHP